MIRVLIVEDKPEVAEAIGAILSLHDCQIAVAYSGSEAVVLVERDGADVIVLDHDLPDFNGREVHLRVRGKRPDLPIIFVSGNHPELHDLISARPDCTGFLQKPFEEEALMGLIRRFCT